MAVIGIDLGGTKLAAAAFSSGGAVLARSAAPLDGRTGSAVAALITDTLTSVIDECPEDVEGVGTCVPGIYTPATGRVWAPNIPGWEDFPLRDALAAAVARDVHVRIASDRACCVLGEIWQGAARDCTDVVFLAVGTGIGAGIVSGGRIVKGRHGIAGAVGWMALDRPFRTEYERWGCFEYAASGDGLVRRLRDLAERNDVAEHRDRAEDGAENRRGDAPKDDDPAERDAMPNDRHPRLKDLNDVTARDVFAALNEGDAVARRVIDEAVELWGMAVANLVSLLDPEKIIFGGGIFGPALALLDRIRREAERWAQPIAMKKVVLEGAQLGADAGMYGAAKLALDAGDHDHDVSERAV